MKLTDKTRVLLENRIIKLTNALENLVHSRRRSIFIDYPPTPKPRYGYGLPPHQGLYDLINRYRTHYEALLENFKLFHSGLSAIDSDPPKDATQPYWKNGWLGGTNAIALYCLPAIHSSKRYVEIGSGNSTKFVRRSIKDNGLVTHITSIDPHPRAEVDGLCDEILRCPFEQIDLKFFDGLESGDIVVLDGSHRCFQNSDVTVFFLEVLPRLTSGVLVYIDDIFLPNDYPPSWSSMYYSEQYILASLLLGDGGNRYKVILPNIFVEEDPILSQKEKELWSMIGHPGFSGNGFWLQVN